MAVHCQWAAWRNLWVGWSWVSGQYSLSLAATLVTVYEFLCKFQITARPASVWDWPTEPQNLPKFVLAAVICSILSLKCSSEPGCPL